MHAVFDHQWRDQRDLDHLMAQGDGWDLGAIAPSGLTEHQLKACPLPGGALLAMSSRSADLAGKKT